MRLFGYTIGTHIAAHQHADVYAATRDRDGLPVVIKAGKVAQDGTLSPVRREFELLCRIASPLVVRAVDFEVAGDVEAMILERFPGISLHTLIGKQPLPIRDFLRIAIHAAQALADIHAARIVHRDISLKNLLVDPETLALCVIDLGISSELGAAQRHPVGETVEGTLRYISPEQTGRLGQGVDFRSDLYSLGACFYELLTGRPPFAASEFSELILAHIAQVPAPANTLRDDVPRALARVVAKLLEKDPERRYQTAAGLRADLIECQRQLSERGSIDPDLALGPHDAPGKLRFPQRLYGRERDVAALRACFERARAGRLEVAWITGPSGSGKSRLAEELRGPLAAARGYMARAKLDRYRRDRPYAAFVDAFEELLDQLLAGSAEDVERWRERLSNGLGKLAGALGSLLPSLSLLLGALPSVASLGPRETRQQLALAFQRLTRAIATPDHPLVLLLDDLQWADAGSRYLLDELVRDAASSALLVVVTQVAELDDAPAPFLHLVSQGIAVAHLALQPLAAPDLQQMLADVLGRAPEHVRWLADRISLRTRATPQLIREFLLRLQESGALRVQPGVGWVWDEGEVDAVPLSDEAVALAMPRIRALAEGAREILSLASCMGDDFDPEMLLALCGRNRLDTFRDLMTLTNECLIAPSPQGFRFVHNRIREAGQGLLSDPERARAHERIGRFLLERTPQEALASQVLVIADHLNRAPTPADDAVRVRRIELNVAAAQVALAAGASASADGYLNAALALYRDTDWSTQPRLGLRLHLGVVDSAIASGRHDDAERFLNFLEQKSLGLLPSARVAARRIAIRTITFGPRSGVEAALAALDRLGILHWRDRPSWLRVWLEVQATRVALRRRRTFEATRSLDRHREERWLATLLLLSELGPGAFREELGLALLAVCTALRGQAARRVRIHAATLSGYAHLQAAFTGDYASATALADRALEQIASHPDATVVQSVRHQIYVMVRTWTEHRRDQLEPVRQIVESAFELGNNENAFYARFWHACLLMLVGEPLPLAERELAEHLEHARRVSSTSWALRLGVLAALRRLTRGAGDGAPERVPPEACGLIASSRHYANVIGTVEMMVDYLLRRHEEAFLRCEELRGTILRAGSSTPHVSEYFLFRGLIAAARLERAHGRARRTCRSALAQSLRRMRRWAQVCPANFAHLVALLEAERARAGGAGERALALYADAARMAEAERYRQHAALAHERRSALLWELGRSAEASAARELAIAAYTSWGARAKVAQLEQRDGAYGAAGRGAA